MATVEVPSKEKGSFLAFLYGIAFREDVNAVFKTKPDEVMTDYGLTSAQRELVNALHNSTLPAESAPAGTAAAKWASLVALLLPEFYVWTYVKSGEKPFWW